MPAAARCPVSSKRAFLRLRHECWHAPLRRNGLRAIAFKRKQRGGGGGCRRGWAPAFEGLTRPFPPSCRHAEMFFPPATIQAGPLHHRQRYPQSAPQPGTTETDTAVRSDVRPDPQREEAAAAAAVKGRLPPAGPARSAADLLRRLLTSSAWLAPPDFQAMDNKVSIWSVGELSVTSMEDEFEGDPQLLCDYRHGGDVMDLQFLDHERIVTASSTGAVTIFRHHHNSQVDLSFQCFLSEFRPHSVLFFQFKTFFFWFCCLSDCVSVLLLLFSSLRFSGNVHIPKNIILSLIVVKTLFQNVRIGSC
uniref:Nucleoporin 43 n=1 Tax=Lepisosteus oculatus TaxID=7918 RepID=W5NK62_LEPOC